MPELLVQLRIARSSYFYHRMRMCLADKYAAVRHSLVEIFEANPRCYGYHRLQASLVRQSVTISEKVLQRLMKQEQLVVARPCRRRFGSYLGEISPAPEYLINRNFHAKAPNVKWLTDITEFQIPAGIAHHRLLRPHGHQLVDWNAARRGAGQYYAGAIETVTDSSERPIVHSNRGTHYRWPGWLTRISEAKLVRSMSRKGLKTELFYPRDWKAITIEQFVAELDAYVRWYSEKRIKISLGSLGPIEYRRSLGLNALTYKAVQLFIRTPKGSTFHADLQSRVWDGLKAPTKLT